MRLTRQWRSIVALVFLSLLAVVPNAARLSGASHSALGHSVAGDAIVGDDVARASLYTVDLVTVEKNALSPGGPFAIAVLLTLAGQLLLSGGIIGTAGSPSGWGHFFALCRRDLGYHAAFLGTFLVQFGTVAALWVGTLTLIKHFALAGAVPNSGTASALSLTTMLGLLTIFGVFRISTDFARSMRRIEPRLGAMRAMRHGFRLAAANRVAAARLFLLPLLAGGAAMALLVALEWGIDATSGARIALVALLALAAIALRSTIRVATWEAITAFVDRHAPHDAIVIPRPVLVIPPMAEGMIDIASPS